MARILIAYFSRNGENYFDGKLMNLEKGNTALAAEIVHSVVGGELFEIEPIESYPTAYHACTDRAKRERNSNARPQLKKYVDLNSYDIIFIGYPNWWGTMPMPVFSLLEHTPFKNKKIVPFCTHEGSLMGMSEHDLLRLCTDSIVMKGMPIQGSSVANRRAEITAWAKANI